MVLQRVCILDLQEKRCSYCECASSGVAEHARNIAFDSADRSPDLSRCLQLLDQVSTWFNRRPYGWVPIPVATLYRKFDSDGAWHHGHRKHYQCSSCWCSMQQSYFGTHKERWNQSATELSERSEETADATDIGYVLQSIGVAEHRHDSISFT